MGTYNRRVQLSASSQRRKDAESLLSQSRWTGCSYLAGYAIECSLKAWICYWEKKDDFLETKASAAGLGGSKLHRLYLYVEHLPSIFRRSIKDYPELRNAWDIVVKWNSNELRYGVKDGSKVDSESLFEAVKFVHSWILRQQNETPR